jgi:imidazolonepropionase-like amidohydrolase
MTGDIVLPRQTVIVREGVIAKVGGAEVTPVPRGALRIDGRGRFLVPGLIDFHVHLRSPDEFLSYLAHGVTTVVHPSGAERGAPDLFLYRRELEEGKRVGPSLYMSGPLVDGPRPIFPKLAVSAADADDARRIVGEQKAAGYDFVKTYVMLPREAYVELVRAAHAKGLPVIGHTPQAMSITDAFDAGHDLFLHVSDFVFSSALFDPKTRRISDDAAEIARLVAGAVQSGATVAPTLVASLGMIRKIQQPEKMFADPETRYLHPDVRRMWETDTYEQPLSIPSHPLTLRITKALSEAGVPLLVGTDSATAGVFPGRGVHDELALLRSAGLTPAQALQAATRNPGRFLQRHVPRAPRVGIVEPGARADLLLLGVDPISTPDFSGQIEGVMSRGKWTPIADLRAAREALVAAYAAR